MSITKDEQWESIEVTSAEAVRFAEYMLLKLGSKLSPENKQFILTSSEDRFKQVFSFEGGACMVRDESGWLIRKHKDDIYYIGARHSGKKGEDVTHVFKQL